LNNQDEKHANERYELLRPYFEGEIPLARLAKEQGLVLRTVQRWVKRYRKYGKIGLARSNRNDKGSRRVISVELTQAIKSLCDVHPPLSSAQIFREISDLSQYKKWRKPSYSTVYDIVRLYRERNNTSCG
jgi:putative transposase